MVKVYISGPISKDPEQAERDFAEAEACINTLGFEAINPFQFNMWEKGATSHDHAAYMRLVLPKLFEAHMIFMLPGWEQSQGAKGELHIANLLGLPVMYARAAKAQIHKVWHTDT